MYLLAPKTYVFAYTEIFATIIFDKLIFNTWYCDLYYEQCWMNPTEIQIPLTAMAFATESVKLLFVSWANLPKHSVLKMEKIGGKAVWVRRDYSVITSFTITKNFGKFVDFNSFEVIAQLPPNCCTIFIF